MKDAIPRTASREVSRLAGAVMLLLPVIFIWNAVTALLLRDLTKGYSFSPASRMFVFLARAGSKVKA